MQFLICGWSGFDCWAGSDPVSRTARHRCDEPHHSLHASVCYTANEDLISANSARTHPCAHGLVRNSVDGSRTSDHLRCFLNRIWNRKSLVHKLRIRHYGTVIAWHHQQNNETVKPHTYVISVCYDCF